LTFAQTLPTRAMTLLRDARHLGISGVTLRDETNQNVVYQSRCVSTNLPAIIGYIVESVPKIPDTAPGRAWSNYPDNCVAVVLSFGRDRN
jgi:hypothetical protein